MTDIERLQVFKIVLKGQQVRSAYLTKETAIRDALAVGSGARVIQCLFVNDGAHHYLKEQTIWPEAGRINIYPNAGPSWNTQELLQ